MPGNRAGGLKAAATNKHRYGENWYARIGRIGGQNGNTGGFAAEEPGKDGLTGAERAKIAGAKGGHISKRGPAKKPRSPHITDEEMILVRKREELRRLRAEIRALEAEEDWND